MLIAGNWKLNTTLDASVRLAKAIADAVDGSECDVLVCPPFVSIDAVSNALLGTSVHVGAQNVSATDEGAFTGEVSASMLRSVGCSHVIVGHSERRALFGETDAVVATKTARVLGSELTPIVCVGETLEERRADRVADVVEAQLAGALGELSSDELGRVVVAYEPVWAIGTGETASPEQAQEVHALIRAWLSARTSHASSIPLLYGGSMKPANARRTARPIRHRRRTDRRSQPQSRRLRRHRRRRRRGGVAVRLSQMKKPLALTLIVILAWIALGASTLICALSLLALAIPPGDGFFAAFVRGGVEALGHDHATFGAYQVGEVFGSTMFAVGSALLLLYAAKSRQRLWLLRAAAIFWAVTAAVNGQAFLPVIASILSFLPSVRHYYTRTEARETRQASET